MDRGEVEGLFTTTIIIITFCFKSVTEFQQWTRDLTGLRCVVLVNNHKFQRKASYLNSLPAKWWRLKTPDMKP